MKGHCKFEPDTYYHIVNHAFGNENLFRNDENYRFFLNKYANYMPSVCSTIAYCLMPNHIHFMIKTHSTDVLESHPKYKMDFHKLVIQELSNLLNSYAKAYNKVNERKGALWIDFTKRFVIDSDAYYTSTINYIHQNPVKHGFVKSPDGWKFSSFNSFLSQKPTLLNRNDVLNWFGGTDEFVKYHKEQSIALNMEWEY